MFLYGFYGVLVVAIEFLFCFEQLPGCFYGIFIMFWNASMLLCGCYVVYVFLGGCQAVFCEVSNVF